VLHEEIERLPDRLRLPVVLCYLDGLTRDQAADHLRCSEGMVRGRLAKGRELLQRRLTRRGIALAVPPVFPAAIPESLVATTIRAATGGPSAAVGALVTIVSRGWILAWFKTAAAVLLAIGTASATLLGAGLLRPPAAGPKVSAPRPTDDHRPQVTIQAVLQTPKGPAPAAKPEMVQPAPAPDAGPTPVEGRILDLKGRPVAGVTVSVKYVQSPPDGKLDPWIDEVKRLAKPPFGLPIMASPGQNEPAAVTAGRGATLSLLSGRGLVRSLLENLGPGTRRPPFSATTGPDGRFRIDGLPRDGIATASISGASIESAEVYILTRDVPTIRVKNPMFPEHPMLVYYGARFEYVAATAQPIVGTVRDKDTGAPIPGVQITGMPNIPNSMIPTPGVDATTDAQGRYQVNGLSAPRGFKLLTEAPASQPYVNCGFVSPASEPKPGAFSFDITLKRGVLVRGRLTDKATENPSKVSWSILPSGTTRT
jgi:hypothetical protein